MAIYIEDIQVSAFRGIKDLELKNLNHINIIAGNNNSGKTSILEAIYMLRNPLSLYDVVRLSRLRDSMPIYAPSPFESFINMLQHESLRLGINAKGRIGEVQLELSGELRSVIIDKKAIEARNYWMHKDMEEIEAMSFSGLYKYIINSDYDSIPVEFTEYSNFNELPRHRYNYIDVVYLSPARHLLGNSISSIVRSGTYKDLCVYLLQQFDSNIEDILYVKNEITNRPVECIRHTNLGVMPLSTYGDGIKKVIALANGIASAKDGILMIDEVETSIHSKYYKDIFAFLVKACLQFNVQLFVTTHSQEAIDAILLSQEYSEKSNNDDPINVITFRTDKGLQRTLSRTMLGNEVLKNREKFDFEVRL